MRQSGIIAAACLYSLDHHVERLADDHRNARLLADGLAQLPAVQLDPATVETNIIVFGVQDARRLLAAVGEQVELNLVDAQHIRAVTHMDVDKAGVRRAIDAIAAAV